MVTGVLRHHDEKTRSNFTGRIFGIDTGECTLAQGPYNTPSLRESVDKEIDWLIEQGYIRQSDSLWSSPMDTVRKPDGSARICVDFKKIN